MGSQKLLELVFTFPRRRISGSFSELCRARTWMTGWPRPRAISQRLTGKATIPYWSVYSVPLGYSDGESGLSDAEQVGQSPKHDAPGLSQLTHPCDLRLGWKLAR